MKPVSYGLLLFLVGASGCAPERNLTGLETYIGRDLRQLDARAGKELAKQVAALSGDKPKSAARGSFEPWWVKPFTSGNASWVFVEAYPGYAIPDVSGVQIHLFDDSWKLLHKESFPTGFRMFLNDVSIVREDSLQQDLLVVKVSSSGPFIVEQDQRRPAFEQGEYQLQYYARSGDHFVMVRLEDHRASLVQNGYSSHTPFKGPAIPKRTREEWIRSLSSNDPVEQLAAMVWLSGTHLPSSQTRAENVNQEGVEEARLWEAVRQAEETKQVLRTHTSSQNKWVKDYSTFTLQMINQMEVGAMGTE